MSPTPNLDRMERGTWIDWVRHLMIAREHEEVAEHRDKALRAALGLCIDHEPTDEP
jgi:hypothetical protein